MTTYFLRSITNRPTPTFNDWLIQQYACRVLDTLARIIQNVCGQTVHCTATTKTADLYPRDWGLFLPSKKLMIVSKKRALSQRFRDLPHSTFSTIAASKHSAIFCLLHALNQSPAVYQARHRIDRTNLFPK